MYIKGYQLKTDADFDNAIYFGWIVSITYNNKHMGSGSLQAHDEKEARFHAAGFGKQACEFVVCA